MTTGYVARPTRSGGGSARERLLAGMPVEERRFELADISTTVLMGGDGPPLVLLHGPGEFAGKWLRVLPDLVTTHRVIAPDLPGHGTSEVLRGRLDAGRVHAWLDERLAHTCPSPPTLVGHVLGGAIAARYAIDRGDRLARLVLVDSLGLAPFRPAPRFAITMIGFLARPDERSYDRFMRQCSYDLDGLREQMADRWDPFVQYSLELARAPGVQRALRGLMPTFALRAIPPADLARIAVPTTLIWGRHDRATPLRVAERASERHGWPLHVIEGCADDPARDRPDAFVAALRVALGRSPSNDPER